MYICEQQSRMSTKNLNNNKQATNPEGVVSPHLFLFLTIN